MRTLSLLFAAITVAGLLTGCADDPSRGYSTTSVYRENLQTVAVPIWQRGNGVYRRDLEFRLTEALVKRIELDTPYKVVDRSKADTILEGTIVQVDQRVLSFNPNRGTPRDIGLRIVVDFTWTDLRSGEIIVQRKNFRDPGVYYPLGTPNESFLPPPPDKLDEDFFEGSADAVNRLAERIVENMEKPW